MKKILIIICLLVMVKKTLAEEIAYDGFNYIVGENLTGLNGGSGWSSAWTTNNGAGGTIVGGLSYTDANNVQLLIAGNAYSVNSARFFYQTLRDTTAEFGAGDTSAWVSFIVQQANVLSGTNYATLTLGTGFTFGSDAMIAGIGGSTAFPFLGTFYGSFEGAGDSTQTLAAGESAFIVVRFDFTVSRNDTINLWFNPLLNELPDNPLLSLSSRNYASVISGLTLAHGDDRSFVYDEIKIGTDFASVTPIRPDSIFKNGFE